MNKIYISSSFFQVTIHFIHGTLCAWSSAIHIQNCSIIKHATSTGVLQACAFSNSSSQFSTRYFNRLEIGTHTKFSL